METVAGRLPLSSDGSQRAESCSASQQPWEDRAHEAGWPFLLAASLHRALGAWACPASGHRVVSRVPAPAGLALQPWQWCREPGALFPRCC